LAVLCSILGMFLFNAPILYGQSVTKISGEIFGVAHGIITGAKVSLFSVDQLRETKLDNTGRFELSGLPAGAYDLQVEMPGFRTKTIENVRMGGKDAGPFSITLEVLPSDDSCNDQPPPTYENSKYGKAGLIGLVRDYGGKVIPNARVEIEGSGRTRVTTSSEKGLYRFEDIEPGKYVLSVMHPDYSPFSTIRLWIMRENLTRATFVMIRKGHLIACPPGTELPFLPEDTMHTRPPNQELFPPAVVATH